MRGTALLSHLTSQHKSTFRWVRPPPAFPIRKILFMPMAKLLPANRSHLHMQSFVSWPSLLNWSCWGRKPCPSMLDFSRSNSSNSCWRQNSTFQHQEQPHQLSLGFHTKFTLALMNRCICMVWFHLGIFFPFAFFFFFKRKPKQVQKSRAPQGSWATTALQVIRVQAEMPVIYTDNLAHFSDKRIPQ